jgi:hypothetical protein
MPNPPIGHLPKIIPRSTNHAILANHAPWHVIHE